ncbi:MAG: EF-P beta-lysylation protein EpmB [Planctomycetaceae bacterium]|nr:EF-P beta-lysylation protein EpmB [Planctomycetaceae bacterium]
MQIVTRKVDSVPASVTANEDWQQALKSAVRDPDELIGRLRLPARYLAPARQAAREFPVFAPLDFIRRMEPGNPHDPLLRQVLPLGLESRLEKIDLEDPLEEASAIQVPGLLQKYAGRALLIASGTCAIHCRYCFRRHFPYQKTPRSLAAWQPALQMLAEDPSLEEILLSGGDPLTLVDSQLDALMSQIDRIEHVRRLRIHTRLPIVIPERVTKNLVANLKGKRMTTFVVVHANHSAEIDDGVGLALRRLLDEGITVLNQAVLLKGVNDSLDALVGLSRQLVNVGVLPYYLHQLDRVAGASHFEVPVTQGRQLVNAMRDRLPGYAVPRYVIEKPGGSSKEVIS